jgi:hypothetical protein
VSATVAFRSGLPLLGVLGVYRGGNKPPVTRVFPLWDGHRLRGSLRATCVGSNMVPSTSPGVADTNTMAIVARDVIINLLFDESDYSQNTFAVFP